MAFCFRDDSRERFVMALSCLLLIDRRKPRRFQFRPFFRPHRTRPHTNLQMHPLILTKELQHVLFKRVRQREAYRKWRIANPEKARAAGRRWRAENPEKQRGRYAANPAKLRDQTRKWRAANREKERNAAREARAANPEKGRKACRKWRAANLEKERTRTRRQRAADPACSVCATCGNNILGSVRCQC